MNPRGCLQIPDAVRVFLLKLTGQLAENCVIVGCLIVAHTFPVERFRRGLRFRIVFEHFGVPAFCISPVLAHERDARERQFQLRAKFACRQIAFDTKPLFSVWIENDHAWRPQRVEPVEIRGVLFDVCFERHEVVVNKRSSLVIAVRLGFQPSTRASRRRGAKVDEQRLLLSLGFRECRVGVS